MTEASSGAVVFGGYDTAKYKGELATFSIITQGLDEPRLAVPFISLSVTDANDNTTLLWYIKDGDPPKPAILDSGTPITRLPIVAYAELYLYLENVFNIKPDKDGYVDCGLAALKGQVNFGFYDPVTGASMTISVPFSEIAPQVDNGRCGFGFLPEPLSNVTSQPIAPFVFFGDTMMRSAYMVFNYDTQSISLAQANFNVAASNLVTIV